MRRERPSNADNARRALPSKVVPEPPMFYGL